MSHTSKPTAPEGYQAQWASAAQRNRLLEGKWAPDLQSELCKLYSTAKVDLITKALNLSKNPFKTIINQIAILYDEQPVIQVNGESFEAIPAHYWQLAQVLNQKVQGLQECAVKVTVDTADPTVFRLAYKLINPDYMTAEAANDNPDVLVKLTELVYKRVPADLVERYGSVGWFWEVWDIANDRLQILTSDCKYDCFKAYYPEALDNRIPYRDNADKPILPFVLYHARTTGCVWNGTYNEELVAGTLRLAAQWSGLDHAMVDAAYPQRYGVNVRVPSATIEGKGQARRQQVAVDPTSILMFETSDQGAGTLGQFSPAIDVEETANVLSKLEADLAIYAGLSPADLTVSGDAKSGYAISISRDGLKRVQRKQVEQYRGYDQQLCVLVARLSNKYAAGVAFSENPEDYAITYAGIKLTKEEMDTLASTLKVKQELGIANRVDFYIAFNPGTTREQAIQAIQALDAESKLLEGTDEPSPDPAATPPVPPAAPE